MLCLDSPRSRNVTKSDIKASVRDHRKLADGTRSLALYEQRLLCTSIDATNKNRHLSNNTLEQLNGYSSSPFSSFEQP